MARAARQLTGLPPNVLAWLPLGQSITFALGDDRPQRHPAGDPLGQADDVRLDAQCSTANSLPGAAHARLHLVGHEQDAVLVAEVAQRRQEAGGGNG